MKRNIRLLVPALLLVALAAAPCAHAQPAVAADVFGNGASDMTDGTVHLRATVGQVFTGNASATGQQTWQGFWYEVGRAVPSAAGNLPPSVPGEFALKPNFPNPFNPTTQIVFDVPRAALVTIRVYNITGELVTTLADRPFEAGQHEIQWNADRWASGMYLIAMTAPAFHSVRTVTLLK